MTSEVAGEDALAVSPDEIPTVEDVLRLSRVAGALVARRGDDAAGVLGRQLQPLFAMTSGLRFGELAALRPIDVDTRSLVVRVTRQLVEPERAAPYIDLPKGSKTRQSVFAGWLADDLAAYVAMRREADGPEGWLWPSPRGGHLRRNNHSRWWLPVRRAAGWADDWTWHSLRHLFAVTALAPAAQGGWGMSLEDVSQLLGHHAADFTSRRYLSVRANHITRAADTARVATRPALAPPPDEPSQYLGPRRAR